MGKFETSSEHSGRWHQPVRVPSNKEGIFGAAKELAEDMDGWTIQSVDEESMTITARPSQTRTKLANWTAFNGSPKNRIAT